MSAFCVVFSLKATLYALLNMISPASKHWGEKVTQINVQTFVVYSNGQFVSLEQEGEKRLGRRKMMTKMGKDTKEEERWEETESRRQRGPHLYPGPCWLPLSFPASSEILHSKPQHGIRTYSKYSLHLWKQTLCPRSYFRTVMSNLFYWWTIQGKIKHL